MSSSSSLTTQQVPIIHVSNLTYTYNGSHSPALKEINLDIYHGEFVIVAGPSGGGKSTLARCLTGFIPKEYPGLYQGTVTLLNQNIASEPIRNLARSVSLVQQDPDSQLVTLHVTNELAFGLENFQFHPDEIITKIKWATNAISAENLQSRNTHTLSGGEKQKVIIASALALQCPILILDEPTARLDPHTATEVIIALKKLHKEGITILVIEHRIELFLTLASRVLLINEGRLCFDGTPEQFSTLTTTQTDLGVALHPSGYSEAFSPSPSSEQNLLEVRRLSFTYPRIEEQSTPTPALQNITFSSHPGEIIALMGANGSGKSTLLLLLMGLLTPDSGTIHLRNQDIQEQPVSKLARNIGFIFQNPLHQLFASTVKEEVLLASRHLGIPAPQVAERRANELLEVFELHGYKNQSPYTLSLGEQRRLTIASILLHHPAVLLLDEPFIGQDYRNVHRIMKILHQEASQGTTILLATHDAAIAKLYCQRLLFLYDGQLLIDAPVKEGIEYTTMLEHTANSQEPICVEGESEK